MFTAMLYGRGSTDPERPWLHHYPILTLTCFLQSQFFSDEAIPHMYRCPIHATDIVNEESPMATKEKEGKRKTPVNVVLDSIEAGSS